MAEVRADRYIARSPSKDEVDHDIEVQVVVKGTGDAELNGWHTVNFDWTEEEVTFHSHVLPQPLEIIVSEEEYGVIEEVLEAAVGHLVDEGYEVTADT